MNNDTKEVLDLMDDIQHLMSRVSQLKEKHMGCGQSCNDAYDGLIRAYNSLDEAHNIVLRKW